MTQKVTSPFSFGCFSMYNTSIGATLSGSEGEAGIHFPHTPFSSRPARADGSGISLKMGSR
ncbi:hypothetical protein HY798_02550 [Candidatus Falkowbacteria bacterium]|nr:hypothetical protein [Candidatus Falkowbacteria bacterium]